MDAYLDTQPDEMKTTRRKQQKWELPPAGSLGYLLDIFSELGTIVSDIGGQLRPLNWQDLAGYKVATGQRLAAWECKALIDLSIVYLSEHFRAKNPSAMAPFFGSKYT